MGRQRRTRALPAARFFLAASATALALLVAAPASIYAAPTSCADLVTPQLNNDTSAGLITAGPALVAPSGSAGGYNYAVNSDTDELEFYLQSAPGVGPTPAKNAYTRKLSLALTGTGQSTWAAASAAASAGCKKDWDRFLLSATPADVSILSGSDLTSSAATGAASACYFDHHWSIAWNTFRTTLAQCGFTQANNGTFLKYSGRLHVQWADYDSMSSSNPVHTAASTWYPVTVAFEAESTSTTNPASNTEQPYLDSFNVTSLEYINRESLVAMQVGFSIATKWPYYPYLPPTNGSQLVGASGVYSGLSLGSWPSAEWLTEYVDAQDGPSNCSQVNDLCTLVGKVTYTWNPSVDSSSCSIAGSYQLNFQLGCLAANGSTNVCDQPMRQALNTPTLGTFAMPETVLDLCKAATVPSSSAPPVGGAIGFTSSLGFRSSVNMVRYREYQVSRADMSSASESVPAYWELWDRTNNAPSAKGALVEVATAASNDDSTGKSWTLVSSFTPNKLVNTNNISSLDYGHPDRAQYMIVFPDDRGTELSFRVNMVVRIWTGAITRKQRRMLWSDMGVSAEFDAKGKQVNRRQLGKRQAGGSDLTLDSGPLGMNVPSSIPYNASFLVDAVTYSKTNDGVVTAIISYHVEVNWPYYAYYANTTDGAQLINTAGTYGGLQLTSYPQNVFTSSYINNQDGLHDADGNLCTSNGQKCVMAGLLNFAWKPTPGSNPSSCSLSSALQQQFNFKLGCLTSGFNDPADCDQDMRTVVNHTDTFGAWKLSGNVDFCKSAVSDYGITWTLPFDVGSTTRAVGQPITAAGTFKTDKKLAAVKIEGFRVTRSDLASSGTTSYWGLWNPDMTSNYATDTGSLTEVGNNVNFLKTVTTADGGFSWRIDTSFTPNVKMTAGASSTNYEDRPLHMIVLPWDNGKTLSYTITLVFRMFADQSQTPTGRLRRLMYRQVDKVQNVTKPKEMERAETKTRPVSVTLNTGAQSGTGTGNQPVQASGGLSSGAIAGIAVLATAVVVAATVAGVVVYRRKKAASAYSSGEFEVATWELDTYAASGKK